MIQPVEHALDENHAAQARKTTQQKCTKIAQQIPGHGEPTDMQHVTRDTRDYLVYMRNEMAKLIDDGKELSDAYKVDQSAYSHLDTFEELAKQNAGIIFRAMEFE